MKKTILLISLFLLYYTKPIPAQSWANIGMNLSNGSVMSMQSFNNKLYLGGYNMSIGGTYNNGIIQWDGSNWDSLVAGFTYGLVTDLTVYNNELIAVGAINNGLNVCSRYREIAKWTGIQWDTVGNFATWGMDPVFSAQTIDSTLFVGTDYNLLCTHAIANVSKWNGVYWDSLSGTGALTGYTYIPRCFEKYNDTIYYGCDEGLVYWADSSAGSVSQVPWRILSLAVFNGELYAGGDNALMKYNGTNWSILINSITVYSMKVFNNALYVGGDFQAIAGDTVNSIIKWDGTNYTSFDDGIKRSNNYPGQVWALEEYNGELYVGGTFDSAGGIYCKGIAKLTPFAGISGIQKPLSVILLSPNPASTFINISSEGKQTFYFSITDVLGKEIYKSEIKNNFSELNISQWNKGIYFVEIIDEDKNVIHKKIIKQ